MPNQDLILKRLQEEGQKTASYFQTLTAEQFQQQVYTTGPLWRVRDLLAHFVITERTFEYFGRDILNGGPGAPEDFVIDEYNATQVGGLKEVSTNNLVAQFLQAREQTVVLVRGMTDVDLERIGRHPWFGKVPLGNMLKLVYRHTMLHERDIRKALETGGPVPHVDAQPTAAS